MSERSQIVPAPEGEYFETSRFSGLSLLLAGGAVVGLLLCLIGAIRSPTQFSFSWMFGFFYFFTLCCGCLFWTIVHHATDAEWSVVVRRQLNVIARARDDGVAPSRLPEIGDAGALSHHGKMDASLLRFLGLHRF